MISKKILVVDDEAIIRELFEHFLSKDGYSVYTAATVEEALQILGQQSIPVMFIDLSLGLNEMNGFELGEKIRKENPNAIIYALTGYANLFNHEEFRKAGFDNWFAKPVSIHSIRLALEDAIEKIDRYSVIERILIIGDDDQFREMLREMLELEGYTVSEASGAEEGILRQSEQPADLIIVDVEMPGKDGVDTMLEIERVSPEARFIMVSGESGYLPKAKLRQAQILGARTLCKPFRRNQLLKIIEQLQNSIESQDSIIIDPEFLF
ncbi:MAG: response regulator [Desulfobacterales bacterium]|jgi:CheY-like chemotaxis protein